MFNRRRVLSGVMGGRRWTPARLDGLMRWFRAPDADVASTWVDSTTGIEATATGAPEIVTASRNGKSVMRFDGASSYSFTAANGSDCTLFFAAKCNAPKSSLIVLTGTSGTNYLACVEDPGLAHSFRLGLSGLPNDGGSEFYVSGDEMEWALVVLTITRTERKLWINGTLTETHTDTASADFSFENLGGFGSFLWLGDLGEIGYVDRAVSESEVIQISRYLQREWTALPNLIVCDGNSLTAGNGATAGNSYPDQLAALLGSDYVVENFGVGGQTTNDMSVDAATQIDPLLKRGRGPRNIVAAWEITNALMAGDDAQTAYDDYVAYCQSRRAAGFKVVAVTVLPRYDDDKPAFEPARLEVNTMLRANWSAFADGFADVAADSRFDDYTNTTYYSDQTHLTDTGYAIVANIVGDVVAAL